jgi:hypothetical protein
MVEEKEIKDLLSSNKLHGILSNDDSIMLHQIISKCHNRRNKVR